ncbi:reverse transcriptase domain-containing protein [Tanacetum coccineum]
MIKPSQPIPLENDNNPQVLPIILLQRLEITSLSVQKYPTSHAKLVTGESSRKSVNFRTLLAPAGNEDDVAISLHSVIFLQVYLKDGIDTMLENVPWFIRSTPFILKKWNPDVNLLKEGVGNVPVWVKFHGIPMTAFSGDGLSVIASKLGTPLMLDSYTSDMYMKS